VPLSSLEKTQAFVGWSTDQFCAAWEKLRSKGNIAITVITCLRMVTPSTDFV